MSNRTHLELELAGLAREITAAGGNPAGLTINRYQPGGLRHTTRLTIQDNNGRGHIIHELGTRRATPVELYEAMRLATDIIHWTINRLDPDLSPSETV